MNTIIKYCFIFFLAVSGLSNEDIFEQSAGESANRELIQVFEYYRDNPIDLRTSSINELTLLPFINPRIAQSVLDSAKTGKYKSINEILLISELDEKAEYILKNCVSIGKSKGFAADARIRLIDRFQNVEGFQDGDFAGTPMDLFTRTRVAYNNYEVNFAQNKNAGERSILQTNRISGAYSSQSTKVVIGDQQIKRGLGLGLSNGFAVRKSPEPTAGFLSYGEGLTPSRSIFEFARFRGVGVQHKIKIGNSTIEPIGYYYNSSRPATVRDNGTISSIYSTGLFRTENEIEKLDAYNEEILGAGLEYSYLDNLLIGLNIYKYEHDIRLDPSSYRYFSGTSGLIKSSYFLINRSNYHGGAEVAFDANNNFSFVFNNLFNINNINILIAIRHLSPETRLQYSNVITESSVKSNEEAVYIGIEHKGERTKNNLYIDYFRSIKRVDDDFQMTGYEILDDLIYKFKKGNINLRFRYESKSGLEPKRDIGRYIYQNRSRTSFRIDLNKSLKYNIDVRIRSEYANIDFRGDEPAEDGLLSFVEVKKDIINDLKMGFRYTFYNTDSFQSAIWHFEYLVPGYMISPPLYLQGNKLLAFLNYKFNDFSIWLRYTRDKRHSTQSLGSSNDEINGNIDERLYFQIDWRFR